MDYLIFYFSVLGILSALWGFVAVIRRRLKYAFLKSCLQASLEKHIKEQSSKYSEYCFLSSYVIEFCVKNMLSFPLKKIGEAIDELDRGRWRKLYHLIKKKDQGCACCFYALHDLHKALKLMEKMIFPHNPKPVVLLCGGLLYAWQQDQKGLNFVLEKVRSHVLYGSLNSLYAYLQAKQDGLAGNFDTALRRLAGAGRFFAKNKRWCEAANVMYEVGEIYRVCRFAEQAFSAYDEAQKLYASLDFARGLGQVLLKKGMLLNLIENYSSALFYLKSSKEKFRQIKDSTGIDQCLIQEAVSHIGLCHYKRAFYSLSCVKETSASAAVWADALNVSAYLSLKTKKYDQGIIYADQAAALYRRLGNTAGRLNVSFVKAQILVLKGDAGADKLCRIILKNYIPVYVFFSKADVLSLRADIRFRQGMYLQAIKYYKLSLEEELNNKNFCNAFVDYRNLALAATKAGKEQEAENYRSKADELQKSLMRTEKSKSYNF